MDILTEKINILIKNKNLSKYQLSKMLNYDESSLNKAIKQKMAFPEHIIQKLLPILEVSRDEFDSWIIADKYSKEIIELAIKAKRDVCHPAPDAGSNKQTNINGKIPDLLRHSESLSCKPRVNSQQHHKSVRNDRKKKLILTTKIDAILEEKGISRTALAKQIKYSQSSINAMIVGKRNISKSVLERMSEILEVTQDEITSWILADSYSLDTLKMAYAHNNKDKSG